MKTPQVDRIKAIDKVKKLLALTTSSNENEAKLAREMADRIIAKHGLTTAEVTPPTSQQRPLGGGSRPNPKREPPRPSREYRPDAATISAFKKRVSQIIRRESVYSATRLLSEIQARRIPKHPEFQLLEIYVRLSKLQSWERAKEVEDVERALKASLGHLAQEYAGDILFLLGLLYKATYREELAFEALSQAWEIISKTDPDAVRVKAVFNATRDEVEEARRVREALAERERQLRRDKLFNEGVSWVSIAVAAALVTYICLYVF